MGTLHYQVRDGIVILTLDNPPVNGLNRAIRAGLIERIAQAELDDTVRAVVINAAGRLFCGGADVKEFGAPPQEPSLSQALSRIEDCSKPVVAAVHGVAAGGGLELALACHWRVASEETRIGLPEVKLGIVPGAGGTQRLPRLIGVDDALRMITEGDLTPVESIGSGLFDAIVPQSELVSASVSMAKDRLKTPDALRRTRNMQVSGDRAVIDSFINKQSRRWRGLAAPQVAADLIRSTLDLSFSEGLQAEREAYLRLRVSPEAKALQYLFFAERNASKLPPDISDSSSRSLDKAGVVGAGTMGCGIAMNFLNTGKPVTILERNPEALERGIKSIRANYERSVASGRISSSEMNERLALLSGSVSYEDLSDSDIVIEAVFEDMATKIAVFQELERVVRDDAILASNTSTLDINSIAGHLRRPDRFVGTHFFSPANIMKLMENVRAKHSSSGAVASVMRLGKELGKLPVLVGVCFGFVGNRMLYAYTRQANFLIEEGASPQKIDEALYDFGLPMGPFQMSDLTGIDVGYSIRKANADIMTPAGERGFTVADKLAESGLLGQKGGLGWYRYDEQRKQIGPNPMVADIIRQVTTEKGYSPRNFTSAEIIERCMFPLVNEGAKLLSEGIASRVSDIDVIWTLGYGFPRHRGGPMYWADRIGLDRILETMQRLHRDVGEWCRPAPLLESLVKRGITFSQWSAEAAA